MFRRNYPPSPKNRRSQRYNEVPEHELRCTNAYINDINFCPSCGKKLNPTLTRENRNAWRHTQQTQRQQYQSNSSYNSGDSGTGFMSAVVAIILIVIMVSCSDTGASSNTSKRREGIDEYPNSDTIVSNTEDVPVTPISNDIKTEASAPQEYISYRVKQNDTLYSIAQKFLGDGNRWTEIDALNKIEKLPNGSPLIFEGLELRLPLN